MAIGYIYKGRFVLEEEYLRLKSQERCSRSGLPCPQVIQDTVEVQSMVDGKVYTSKAALRSSYRANGVEEIGNEKLNRPARKEHTPEGVSDDIRRAISQLS